MNLEIERKVAIAFAEISRIIEKSGTPEELHLTSGTSEKDRFNALLTAKIREAGLEIYITQSGTSLEKWAYSGGYRLGLKVGRTEVEEKGHIKEKNELAIGFTLVSQQNVKIYYKSLFSSSKSRLGTSNPAAKIDFTKAQEIRKLNADGKSVRKLAAKFGISKSQINNIILGKNWNKES